MNGTLKLQGTGIQHPVLIDVVSGNITVLTWKKGTVDELENLPIKDSVMAIADETYFDWQLLPEAPSSLRAVRREDRVELIWETHGGNPQTAIVERRNRIGGKWAALVQQPASKASYTDSETASGPTCYRVSLANSSGRSAYSNVARFK